MCNQSMIGRSRALRARVLQAVFALGGALIVSLPSMAQAQATTVCGPEVKAEIVKALAGVESAPEATKASLEAELYSKYQYCGIQDGLAAPSTFKVAARECGASVPKVGSLFYEEMPCCGYDPQRRQFACPVTVKQPFGFGPAPLPGSREYVLHCVADPAGNLVPVGQDSVHLADAIGNQPPSWQFAVIAAANQNLNLVQPMNGMTRRARSILSWGFRPNSCNFAPIWGNVLDYRIRLDQ